MKTIFNAEVNFESPELEAELARAIAALGVFEDGIALVVPADGSEAEFITGQDEFTREIQPDDWVIFSGRREESLVDFFARELRNKL